MLECVCRARELPGFSAALSVLRGDAAWLRDGKRLQIFYKRETNVGQMEVLAGAWGVSAGLRRIHEAEVGSGVT